MPNSDPNEFTDREKFILSYFRNPDMSASRRMIGYDAMIGAASLLCVIFAVVREEMSLGFVAYALVLGRLSYLVAESGKWTRDYQSIFRKYDAKLKAAAENRKD